MSAMEDSLRRALEGGDTRDPAFRESIYAASERALERMLESRGADEASALDQRTRLAETINRVEADFAPHSYPAEAQPHEFHEADPYDAALPTAPSSETAAFSGAGGPTDDEPHEGAGWTPGGGRPAGETPSAAFNWKVPALAVLLALGLALLAYAITGALRGGSSADPATTSAIQPSDGLPKLAWIDVFDGNDLESLSTPTGGRIEAVASRDVNLAIAPGLGTSPSDVDLYSLRLRDLS